ncbi:MAG: type IV secretory system conjugative DNA transfer family protein [Eubacteriales bacterium]
MNNTYRILAKGQYMDNNTRNTGVNNNDLIIGPSGAGKTRGYVKPNIMQGNENLMVTDTKGDLRRQLEPLLLEKGYDIKCIDFKDIARSDGYNPFDHVHFDEENGRYSEQDMKTIAEVLVPDVNVFVTDPFWEQAARTYLLCMIAYLFEACHERERNLDIVFKLYACLSGVPKAFAKLMNERAEKNPDSVAWRYYTYIEENLRTERTHRCIMMTLAERFNGLITKDQIRMYQAEDRINFRQISERKTVIFLNVSDTDRSMDRMVSMFYAQALNKLCNIADKNEGSRLTIPIRFIFDDFATNCVIPNFSEIISVIRSREIYVSIILQSISQLNGLYGVEKAKTIINNCNNCLYLGGQDMETAKRMANKAGVEIRTILNMSLKDVYLFTSGRQPLQVEQFDITKHPDYSMLPEAKREEESIREHKRNTYRILAQGEYMDNNTWNTRINNNDLIIGPSGAGKTRSYVKPNIMQGNESLMITDTKGDIRKHLEPLLQEKGYTIKCIDLKESVHSDGYNPFDHIRYNQKTGTYVEQDILTMAQVVIPDRAGAKDPFWNQSARLYLQCLIAYVLETEKEEVISFRQVGKIFEQIKNQEKFNEIMDSVKEKNSESFAVKIYELIVGNEVAEKTHASIIGVMAERISVMVSEEYIRMYELQDRLDFTQISEKKTAVFLIVSDTDRSNDTMVSMFYTQALNKLCTVADNNHNSCLQIPVRFILDDFATNCVIPNFPEIISVIRSREIYVSVILQSISQLNGLYRKDGAETIINNCDNCLYLGGQDDDTAEYIGVKAGRTMREILAMPVGGAYLFTRGRKARQVQKFDIRKHPEYKMLLGEDW